MADEGPVLTIDLQQRGLPRRGAAYLLPAEKPALIEAGGSASRDIILAALRGYGVRPEEIRYLVVTHVHIDHAGGAGILLADLPRAEVVVHPRGARHLADPARLVAGAAEVYGGLDKLVQWYGPVEPVPESRLRVQEDDSFLALGRGRELRFFDTPGHARHHFAVYEVAGGHLFTGDVFGMRFTDVPGFPGPEYILPSTAPNQFDPAAMSESLDRLLELRPACTYPTHCAAYVTPLPQVAERLKELIPRFASLGTGPAGPLAWPEVRERLWDLLEEDLRRLGCAVSAQTREALEWDLFINAQGIAWRAATLARPGAGPDGAGVRLGRAH